MSAPEEVLAAVERGWSVIPVGSDKRSLIPWKGAQEVAATVEQVEAWAERNPPCWAVVTGKLSGVVVLDIDGQEGADSLHDLEAQHGALPPTMSVATPRGGVHYYFRWPGHRIKNSTSEVAPSIDVRGDGGIALIPPSRTIHGTYERDATVSPVEMPAWLITLICAEHDDGHAAPPDVWTAMIVNGIRDGSRNVDLARLTGYLLRRWVAVDVTAALVHLVNEYRCRPPKSRAEVDAIIDSISRSELRRREARS